MMAILSFAGLAGFLASALLLGLGVVSMPLRYALAVLLAYGTFLLAIRVWLQLKLRRTVDASWADGLDPAMLAPDAPAEVPAPFEFGGGGGFSGGGAGGALDSAAAAGEGGIIGEAVAGAAESGEGAVIALPIVLVLALLAGLVGVVLLVAGAPVLLGEVLLDGLIAGTAYRLLREESSPRHWTTGVFRRTWKSALALLLVLAGAGWLIQWLLPAARSIGDIVGR